MVLGRDKILEEVSSLHYTTKLTECVHVREFTVLGLGTRGQFFFLPSIEEDSGKLYSVTILVIFFFAENSPKFCM